MGSKRANRSKSPARKSTVAADLCCVVRCLVEPVPVRKDLAPDKGRIYDPACGSGGMFVQSELPSEATARQFVESYGGVAKCEVRSASVEVKTSRPFVIRNSAFGISPARRLAVMNLALVA